MNKMISYSRRSVQVNEPDSKRVFVPFPDVAEKNKQLFDLIYEKDPTTGLPKGDIAIFLSDKANPEVKAFIESSLMNPVPEPSGLSLPQQVLNKFGSVITDEDIAYFSRDLNETVEEFGDRMRLYAENQKMIARKKRDNAELMRILEHAKKGLRDAASD